MYDARVLLLYYETTITGDTPSGSANNVDHVTTGEGERKGEGEGKRAGERKWEGEGKREGERKWEGERDGEREGQGGR